MRKTVAILLMVTLAISVYGVASLATPAAAATTGLPEYQPIDIANAPKYGFSVEETIQGPTHHSYWEVGDIAYWLIGDFWYGTYRLRTFQLRAIGEKVEVWVQTSLQFPSGDPRNADPNDLLIMDEQVNYFVDQFETNILPTDSQVFGTPDPHNGSNAVLDDQLGLPSDYYYDETGRNVILVANTRDENYYNYTYPYYTIGFYSPTFEYYFDRNIITIDCWQWWNRTGPLAYEWIPGKPVMRPYTYESTIAHEYQHLIHDDWNPADDLFMNEGCSMYAEVVCGYGIDSRYFNSYFFTPDNSLTIWGDQGDINILADYGVVALWTIYLSDHYGGAPLITYFVQAGVPGIDGVNNALSHFKYKANFLSIYHDWRLANLIRSNYPGCGRYNYKSLNLNDPSIIPVRTYQEKGLPVPWTKGTDFGNTFTILGYDTLTSRLGAFGTDYIAFNNWRKPGVIYFDGDDTAVYGWTYDASGGYWWSNGENLMNTLLVGQASIPAASQAPVPTGSDEVTEPGTATLNIVTKYDIEEFWDFGFVQVSTDNGITWTSLSNIYTTSDHDPSAHPAIIANLPGLTGLSPDYPDWTTTTMTFDLSAYAGQSVLIGFRYMTDWATLGAGWFIKSATINDVPLTLTPVYPEADYQVTLVYAYVIHRQTFYVPFDMRLKDQTETGSDFVLLDKPSYVILVVSPTMLQGSVDYSFKATAFRFCHIGHWMECC